MGHLQKVQTQALHGLHTVGFIKFEKKENIIQHPKIRNGHVLQIRVEKSIRRNLVKE